MRWGELGWVVFLAGLPFSHLLNRSLDVWHGHTLYAHSCLLILWACSFASSKATKSNWPIACWVGWVGTLTLWLWTNVLLKNKMYPFPILMGLFHCLSVLMFYQAAMTQWTRQVLNTIFLWVSRVGTLVLIYCGLQLLNLDQIFNDLNIGHTNDVLVGTIGNPSHLGAYLACLLPLMLLRTGLRWKIATGCLAGLLGYLLIGEKSLGGPFAAVLATTWCCWHWQRKWFWWWIGGVGLLGLLIINHIGGVNDTGRFVAWRAFYEIFQKHPITGFGPGFIFLLSHSITSGPLWQWRHVHNEYFQIAIEQGLIGFAFVGWILVDYWRTVWTLPKTKEVIACAGIMIAFLADSLVNFPAHLWLLGSFGLLAYCGIHVLAQEA